MREGIRYYYYYDHAPEFFGGIGTIKMSEMYD